MESRFTAPYPSASPSSPRAGPSSTLALKLSSATAPTRFTDDVLCRDGILGELYSVEKTRMRNKRPDMAIVLELPYVTTAITSQCDLHEWVQKFLSSTMDQIPDVSFSFTIGDAQSF